MRVFHKYRQFIKRFGKFSLRRKIIFGLFILTALLAIVGFFWALATGRIRSSADYINGIPNQASATWVDSLGNSQSVDSNLVILSLEGEGPPQVTINLTLQLQGLADFSASNITLEIFPAGNPTPIFTKNDVSTDAGGYTSLLVNLDWGNYDVRIKLPHSLSVKLANVALADINNLDFGTLKSGDINPPTIGDNQINGGDFTYLKQKFMTDDPVADINQDGIVNTIDFSVIYTNWGLNGQ